MQPYVRHRFTSSHEARVLCRSALPICLVSLSTTIWCLLVQRSLGLDKILISEPVSTKSSILLCLAHTNHHLRATAFSPSMAGKNCITYGFWLSLVALAKTTSVLSSIPHSQTLQPPSRNGTALRLEAQPRYPGEGHNAA